MPVHDCRQLLGHLANLTASAGAFTRGDVTSKGRDRRDDLRPHRLEPVCRF